MRQGISFCESLRTSSDTLSSDPFGGSFSCVQTVQHRRSGISSVSRKCGLSSMGVLLLPHLPQVCCHCTWQPIIQINIERISQLMIINVHCNFVLFFKKRLRIRRSGKLALSCACTFSHRFIQSIVFPSRCFITWPNYSWPWVESSCLLYSNKSLHKARRWTSTNTKRQNSTTTAAAQLQSLLTADWGRHQTFGSCLITAVNHGMVLCHVCHRLFSIPLHNVL